MATTRKTKAFLVNENGQWLKQLQPPNDSYPDGVYHYTDNLDEAYVGSKPPHWYAHRVTEIPVKVTTTIEPSF